MRIPITGLSQFGMIADQSPHELPLGAFSFVKNMRVQDGALESAGGHTPAFSPPSIVPLFLMPYPGNGLHAWLYADAQKVWALANGTHNNITRQTAAVDVNYSGSEWTGSILNGIPVLNNGSDVPQMWVPPQVGSRLTPLTAWPVNQTAKVLRAFKNHLVALNVTKGAVQYPHLVQWSHPADPGTVPVSWDITDPTKDAGEVSLTDTGGQLVDALSLRDVNVVYKEDAIYLMQYVGGAAIYGFKLVSTDVGALTRNAIAAFNYQGPKHCILTANDVVVFDGNSIVSIITERMRKWLFNTISSADLQKSMVRANPAKNEIWVCFCSDGSGRLETALVWNWLHNTLTVKQLPEITFLELGVVSGAGSTADTWAGDLQTWASDNAGWGANAYNAGIRQLLAGIAVPAANLLLLDTTGGFSGAAMEVVAERTGLTVVGTDKQGNPIEDGEVVKLVTEVWPRIETSSAQQIEVYVGTQMQRDQPVTWSGPYLFEPTTMRKINCLVSGKLISVRFRALSSIPWKLLGYDLELKPIGAY